MKPTTKGEHEYAVHPAAAVFPMIPDDELRALADNIKRNGLLHPVELVNKRIVDGRNRLAACKLAGVGPQFRDLTDTLPNDEAVVRHVIATNLHRRHLTTSQRAAIAAELATLKRGGDRKSERIKGSNDPLTTTAAAKLVNVSPKSVTRAKAVMRTNPAAHEAAKMGTRPKPRIPKPPAARTTSTKAPAPPPTPVKAKEASGAPTSTRRETAPGWYLTFVDHVLDVARAAMRANNVPAAEVLEALDDVYGQLEDEAGGKRA